LHSRRRCNLCSLCAAFEGRTRESEWLVGGASALSREPDPFFGGEGNLRLVAPAYLAALDLHNRLKQFVLIIPLVPAFATATNDLNISPGPREDSEDCTHSKPAIFATFEQSSKEPDERAAFERR
jgi:hypothetical protein